MFAGMGLKSRTQMYADRGALHCHWTWETLWQVYLRMDSFSRHTSTMLIVHELFYVVETGREELLGHKSKVLNSKGKKKSVSYYCTLEICYLAFSLRCSLSGNVCWQAADTNAHECERLPSCATDCFGGCGFC